MILEAFNKALLAKQLSRMITHLHALISRLFKSRYFKHEDIMESKPGYNPSYICLSLIWSRDLLKIKRLIWRIGNKSVKVYNEK